MKWNSKWHQVGLSFVKSLCLLVCVMCWVFFVINDNLYSGKDRKLSCKGMLIAACSRMIKNLSSELARRWVKTRKNVTLPTTLLPSILHWQINCYTQWKPHVQSGPAFKKLHTLPTQYTYMYHMTLSIIPLKTVDCLPFVVKMD